MPRCVGEHDMHSLVQEECGNGLLQAIVPSLSLPGQTVLRGCALEEHRLELVLYMYMYI